LPGGMPLREKLKTRHFVVEPIAAVTMDLMTE
jgi:hypothetical protein